MNTVNDTMHGFAQVCPAVPDLPGRIDAEQALAAAFVGGRQSFSHVAVYSIAGAVSLLDEGNWKEADDDILSGFLDLHRRVSPDCRVFRWTAASLLVLIPARGDNDSWRVDLPLWGNQLAQFSIAQAESPEALGQQIDLSVATGIPI